jgi:hypothetical protein
MNNTCECGRPGQYEDIPLCARCLDEAMTCYHCGHQHGHSEPCEGQLRAQRRHGIDGMALAGAIRAAAEVRP